MTEPSTQPDVPASASALSGDVGDRLPELAETLLGMTPHAVILVDRQHRIRLFNPAAQRLFGFRLDQIIGEPLDTLIPRSTGAVHRLHVQDFFAGRHEARWMHERRPIRGRTSSGEVFPARAAIARLTIGGSDYCAAIVEDLSGIRARERELRRLAEVVESTPDFVGMADSEGNVTYHNSAARRMLGLERDSPGYNLSQSHPGWAARKLLEEGLPGAIANGTWRGQTAILGGSGEEIPMDQVLIAHRNESGNVDRFSTIARDLRPRLAMQSEMHRQAQALEQAGDMIWITDPEGVIVYVNPAFEQATGYSRKEAEGRKTGSLLASGEHSHSFYRRLWNRLRQGSTVRTVFSNRTRDGRAIYVDETIAPVRDEHGRIEAFVASGRDVTERMQLESRLRQLAYQDPLTQLPNRAHLWERLAQAIRHAERTGRGLAVLFLDLDHFKDINDAIGHPAGDTVLREVASRVAGALRRSDSIGRHGGDELLILLEEVHAIDTIEQVAEKILATIRRPLTLGDKVFDVRASIGIARYPEAGRSPDVLITAADAAMYRAKAAGGDRFAFHTAELDERVQERWFLINAMREAEAVGELDLHIQPVVAAGSHALVGAEVFLRWNNAEQGRIEPCRFIPIAEETGQIRQLGLWVLQRACERVAAWRRAGLDMPPLAVNASSVQLCSPDFVETVSRVLSEFGLPSSALVIEMTETAFMGETEHNSSTLEQLRRQGVGIAIDDFGTGYSSLGYLKRFPADRIKLDRDFVREVPDDPANLAIVESVVALGRAFGSTVVAEGVERAEEAATLYRLGVDEMQGFLFGAAQPMDEFERHWLRRPGDGPGDR